MNKVRNDKLLCLLLCIAIGVAIGGLLYFVTNKLVFFAFGPTFGLVISFFIGGKNK